MGRSNQVRLSIEMTDNGTFQIVGRNAQGVAKSIHSVGTSADFADRELKGVAGSTSNSTKEFSKMSQGIGGLVHTYAIFAANIFAVTAAFSALSEAADYNRMIQGAKDLSISTGTNLAGIAASLKDVSAGALTMKEAMQQTSLGVAAGFSGSQMIKLTELATKAGIALGRSVPDAINRLTKAVIKGEPELTDELGIILRLKEATEDYAESIGKTASQLTIGQRSQAVYEQALERGSPKYENVNIDTQPFDKLAASIKEVTTSILQLVNEGLTPFVSFLADSKGIIIIIITLLAKMLITKSTGFFSESFTSRLAVTRERLSAVTKELTYLQQSRKAFNETIDLQGLTGSAIKGQQENVGGFVAGLSDKDQAKLSNEVLSELTGAAESDKIGKAFMDGLSDEVKHMLPRLIKQQVELGLNTVTYPDKLTGKAKTLTAKSTEDLANLGESMSIITATEVILKKEATLLGRMSNDIKRMTASYKEFKAQVSTAALAGYTASSAKGMSEYRDGMDKVKESIKGSNKLMKFFTKSIFKASFGVGKLIKVFDTLGKVINKAFFYFTIAVTIFQTINSIFSFSTDSFAKAAEYSKEIQESMSNLAETTSHINIDEADNINEYKDDLKIILNTAQSYYELIGKSGKLLDQQNRATVFDKLYNDIKSIFKEDKLGSTAANIIEADRLLKALLDTTKEGRDALVELAEAEENASFKIVKTYTDREAALASYTAKLKFRQSTSGFAAGGIDKTVDKKVFNDLIGQLESSNRKSKRVKLNIVEALGLEQKIIKAKNDGNKDLLESLLQQVAKYAEMFGIMDSIEQITKQLEEHGTAGLITARQRTEESQSLLDILKETNQLFNNIKGKANTEAYGKLIGIVDDKQRELENITMPSGNFDKVTAMEEEIARAEERIALFKKEFAFRAEQEASLLEKNITAFEKYMSSKSKTQEQLNDKAASLSTQILKTQLQINLTEQQRIVALEAVKQLTSETNSADAAAKAAIFALTIFSLQEQKKFLEQIEGFLKEVENKAPWKAPKKPKAASKKKDNTISNLANIELEKLKAMQIFYKEVQKSSTATYGQRAKASTELLRIEIRLHKARLEVINANIMDAKISLDKAKTSNDISKAELTIQKAITAKMLERASIGEKIYQIKLKQHEDAKKAMGTNFSLDNFSSLLVEDIKIAAKELRDALIDPITLLTEAAVSLVNTVADSIADAIVENDYSNIRENTAESLKSSAKGFISSGIKGIIGSFIGDPTITAGLSNEQIPLLQEQSKYLAEIVKIMRQEETTGLMTEILSAGSAGSAEEAVKGAMSGMMSQMFGFLKTFLMSIFGFAKGGIMQNAYASGGIVRKPELALIGEGKNNEAVVPLPDNKSIPVKLSGNSGGMSSVVNVVVNSDGTSQTSTESDAKESRAMGELINKAVKQIITDERRPGGLLYG